MIRVDLYLKLVLTVIAISLLCIAFRPLQVRADSSTNLAFEPGTFPLRLPDGSYAGEGRVAVNLYSGEVWGFPTAPGVPYPVNPTSPKLAVSTPVALGRFDVGKIYGSH